MSGVKFSLAGGCLSTALILPCAAEIKVRVIDTDTNKTIAAQVFLRAARDVSPILLADIEDDGPDVIIKHDCVPGDRVSAVPISPDYQTKSPLSCNNVSVTFQFRKKWINDKIKRIASEYENSGEFGKAAQAYNELFALYPSVSYESKFFESVGRSLGVNKEEATIFDKAQNKRVPSQLLVDKIKIFQNQNKLLVDGALGNQTLKALANGTVSKNIIEKE